MSRAVRFSVPLAMMLLLMTTITAVVAGEREGTVVGADGVTIAYDVRGEGLPALVFVHCWSCNRGFWQAQLDAFAEDHTVVALDLPGHGASGRDRQDWTLEAFADDVYRVVEELELDRVVLVGHSMGGPVTLLAAAKLEDRVAGVICSDTLHDADFEWTEEMERGWIESFERDYEQGMRQGIGSMLLEDGALRDWAVDEMLQADREAAMALISALAGFRLVDALAAVETPVRCINAAPYSDFALPTAIETNRRYADFDAVIMDGVGHFPHLERPEEFNARMREILTEMAEGQPE